MITGELKPINEIVAAVSGANRLLVVGCDSCVAISLSGGRRQARMLCSELSRSRHYAGTPPTLQHDAIKRQCEHDLVKNFLPVPPDIDAVLSLACGAGVQILADVLEPLPVYPALNTTFIGAMESVGLWVEKCRGCGDCRLSFTGGICPIAGCAKGLFNGPCGGSQNGACEVDNATPCAWALIYYRLKKQDKLDLLQQLTAPVDWRPAGANGPRRQHSTGLGPRPEIQPLPARQSNM